MKLKDGFFKRIKLINLLPDMKKREKAQINKIRNEMIFGKTNTIM